MGLSINASGKIRISAPISAPFHIVEKFIKQNSEWLDRHVEKFSELRRRFPKQQFSEAERFRFLGTELPLHYRCAPSASVKSRFYIFNAQLIGEIAKCDWESGFDPAAEHHELAPLLCEEFAKAGKLILAERLKQQSTRMQLHPSAVTFRSQRSRWGSCSAQGCISLNWRLVIAPISVIDYVIIHELAHLSFHNHSRNFWQLVEKFDSNFRQHRQWLHDHQYHADFLNYKSK